MHAQDGSSDFTKRPVLTKPFEGRYVPQIRTPWLPHPLLATNITSMDPEHISWTGDHESYNICSVSGILFIQIKVGSLATLIFAATISLNSLRICQVFQRQTVTRSSVHVYSTLMVWINESCDNILFIVSKSKKQFICTSQEFISLPFRITNSVWCTLSIQNDASIYNISGFAFSIGSIIRFLHLLKRYTHEAKEVAGVVFQPAPFILTILQCLLLWGEMVQNKNHITCWFHLFSLLFSVWGIFLVCSNFLSHHAIYLQCSCYSNHSNHPV